MTKNPDYLDVRSVWISDTHIGYKGADLDSLLDFLRRVRCRYLFLNGDIVDSWKLEKRWDWPTRGTDVLREVMLKQLHGTKILYLSGNHDDEFRHIDPIERERWARTLGIKIRHTHVHKAADNKKYLVLHGDQFDAGILRAGLSRWSDKIWVEIAKLLPIKMTLAPGGRVFSLAAELTKKAGKKAIHMISRFEGAALRRARLRGTDGVICGHTHLPVVKMLRKNIMYANSGMWQGQGKNFALVELWDGTIELVRWSAVESEAVAPEDSSPKLVEQADRMTARIVSWLETNMTRKLDFNESQDDDAGSL